MSDGSWEVPFWWSVGIDDGRLLDIHMYKIRPDLIYTYKLGMTRHFETMDRFYHKGLQLTS